MNLYEVIQVAMGEQFQIDDVEDANRERINEFMEVLSGQLSVAMQGGYDITSLTFSLKGHRESSQHPLIVEFELSWPESEESET